MNRVIVKGVIDDGSLDRIGWVAAMAIRKIGLIVRVFERSNVPRLRRRREQVKDDGKRYCLMYKVRIGTD